jgi:hypothetical protein
MEKAKEELTEMRKTRNEGQEVAKKTLYPIFAEFRDSALDSIFGNYIHHR